MEDVKKQYIIYIEYGDYGNKKSNMRKKIGKKTKKNKVIEAA
tara:strand:+ start:381 stop:506 length:126 start_codon:yes stop_codon:yes gene_type:complete